LIPLIASCALINLKFHFLCCKLEKVVRDATGVPEILVRKSKKFREDEGTPSAADDDLAPGAG